MAIEMDQATAPRGAVIAPVAADDREAGLVI